MENMPPINVTYEGKKHRDFFIVNLYFLELECILKLSRYVISDRDRHFQMEASPSP